MNAVFFDFPITNLKLVSNLNYEYPFQISIKQISINIFRLTMSTERNTQEQIPKEIHKNKKDSFFQEQSDQDGQENFIRGRKQTFNFLH